MQRQVLTLLLGSLLGGCSANSTGGTLEEFESWVALHHDRCLESLFERPETIGALRGSYETVVTLRRLSDTLPEVQVTLATNGTGRVEIHKALANGRPLAEQLLELRRHGATEHVACDRVSLTRTHDFKEDPILSNLIEDLRNIRISPIPSSDIILHADTFHVWIMSGIDTTSFELTAASDEKTTGVVHPVVKWCRAVLARLEDS